MNSPHRSLKTLLISPAFQLKLIGYFLGVFAITTVTLYSTIYLFFHNLRSKALSVGIPEGHVFYRFIENQKYDMDLLFLALSGINLFILLGIGFMVSHRIAGPLKKISAHLDSMDQEKPQLVLRENDFLKELVGPINNLKQKLK
jgi:hypothetical protein